MASVLGLLLLGASSLVQSTPIQARTPYAVKETHRAPSKWTSVGDAPGDHVLDLQIGLRQSRFDELERHLYEGKEFLFLDFQGLVRNTRNAADGIRSTP